MSKNKLHLDVLVDSLLQESSRNMQETPGLKWEWEHYTKLQALISTIQDRELHRDGTSTGVKNCENASQTENGTNMENKRRAANFPKFLDWLSQRHGVNFDKVEISYMNLVEGYGLTTKLPLKTGEVVFAITRSAIITSSVARESKIKILAEKDPVLNGMHNVLLAVFLIYERYINADSAWKPYIDILPETYDTVVYFTTEEMAMLKNSPSAFREALRMLRNVARQYSYFHTKFKKATDSASRALKTVFTYNRYAWGVSAVTTRINHLPSAKGEPILSLIPLWDLCNHEEIEVLSTDYNEENDTLVCYAGHDYENNSEFTIFYGRRSSVDFLVHNGFVPQNYRHDLYHLELGVGKNDLHYNKKKVILGKLGLQCQNGFPVAPDQLSTCTKLFAFIRVFLADKDYLAEIEDAQNDLSFLQEPTESCWRFLATRFSILKKAAESSLNSAMKNNFDGMENLERLVNVSRVTRNVLQLLRNELKLLQMLSHCAESQRNRYTL